MFLPLALLAPLAAAAAAASDAASVGPEPAHEVLRPVGLHRDGDARVPGPPAPCVAKAQVYIPWSVCKAIGAPATGDLPHRLEGYAKADPPLPPGTRCALACLPDARLASWSYLLPTPAYRGRVTCPISQRLVGSLVVGPPDAAPTDGATVQWQTDLSVTTYLLDDPALLEATASEVPMLVFEATRTVDPSVSCPAGQPTR